MIYTKFVGDVAHYGEEFYIYRMPVKTSIPFTDGIFSITFTCTNWLPLIETVKGYDIVYSWFDYLKSKGHYIGGYVIMPNPRLNGRAGPAGNDRVSQNSSIH
jgi:hypothetical protein